MGGANTAQADSFPQITDKTSHDAIVNKANQAANIPLVIVVTSSTPTSKPLLADIIQLSKEKELAGTGVQWYEMQMTAETTPMIKFGAQNCPLVILMRGVYCETLLGIRSVEDVARKVREMIGQ